MRGYVIQAVAAAALLTSPPLARAAPSFDCVKASAPVETAICADPALAALDAAIAAAYAERLADLPPPAARALREDQRVFTAMRDYAFSRPDEDLGARLQDRLDFLRQIRLPPAASGPARLSGRWSNVYGLVQVTRARRGRLEVAIETVDPAWGRWVCDVGGEARLRNGALSFTDGDSPAETTANLRLRRDGALLAVEESIIAGQRGYCGANGFTEGRYFYRTEKAE